MRLENTPRPSTTWAMPSRAILYAGRLVTSRPSKSTWPADAVTRPVTVLATVDLPAPLEPTRATTPPAGTRNETSNRARYGP